MAKVQKVYTRAFKEQAVQLAQTSGKSIAQVARELGISDTSIHQWRKELAQHGKEAFPGSGHQTLLEEENRRDPPRTRKSPAGARSLKKSGEHLLTGKQMK
jgi:transposase